MPDPTTPPLGVLALVGQSFRLLGAHFGFLFPIACVPALGLAALTMLVGATPEAAAGGDFSAGGAAALLIGVLVGYVVNGVMCLAALDALLGKRHGMGDYLRQTLRHIVPIVVLGLLLSLATALGTVFLVLPGLYVFARYVPFMPAIVFENAGWSGLARAQALTKGYRWPLAATGVLIGVGPLLIGLLSSLLVAAEGSAVFAIVAEGIVSGAIYVLVSIFTALAYLRLREIKEGATAADIAASFD